MALNTYYVQNLPEIKGFIAFIANVEKSAGRSNFRYSIIDDSEKSFAVRFIYNDQTFSSALFIQIDSQEILLKSYNTTSSSYLISPLSIFLDNSDEILSEAILKSAYFIDRYSSDYGYLLCLRFHDVNFVLIRPLIFADFDSEKISTLLCKWQMKCFITTKAVIEKSSNNQGTAINANTIVETALNWKKGQDIANNRITNSTPSYEKMKLKYPNMDKVIQQQTNDIKTITKTQIIPLKHQKK